MYVGQLDPASKTSLLNKAFDTVDHNRNIQLKKLEINRIVGENLNGSKIT